MIDHWRKIRRPIAVTRVAIEASGRASTEAFAVRLLGTLRYADPRRLNHYEETVYSQHGEDGIIAEILRRVGTTDRFFVEFGVENGLETNKTYLLQTGWRGVWVDADRQALGAVQLSFAGQIAAGALDVRQAFVTAENAAALLRDAGAPSEFDLLSLDIDRNTYHLWRALADYRPRVVVVEYNASIPAADDWAVPYDAARTWNETVYFGASLKAYERLARELGYALVGCDLAGLNAFFVREDLVGDRFVGPFTAEAHFEPPRYWLRWRVGHRRGIET